MMQPVSPDEGLAQHRRSAEHVGRLGFAVLTFSDTRTAETDSSGRLLQEAIAQAGHHVCRYAIVADDADTVQEAVAAALTDPKVAVVVTNGGTGISARDTAADVIARMLEKRLDGFGELFRMLSYEQIGSAAMLSRALAGIAANKPVFVLPGSRKAVELAWQRLILPEVTHIWSELHKAAP